MATCIVANRLQSRHLDTQHVQGSRNQTTILSCIEDRHQYSTSHIWSSADMWFILAVPSSKTRSIQEGSGPRLLPSGTIFHSTSLLRHLCKLLQTYLEHFTFSGPSTEFNLIWLFVDCHLATLYKLHNNDNNDNNNNNNNNIAYETCCRDWQIRH